MTNRKLAIFDWNGTVIADTRQAWKASNECLKFYGVAPISFQKQLETFDFPIIHYYKRNNVDIDLVLKTKTEANEIFQTHYDRLVANARTRRGARALLEWLKNNNYDCIILSNFIVPKIQAQLDRFGIGHYFSHLSANTCDGTSILNSTSKLERLSDFMTTRGYKPANSFIIGDSKEEPDIGRQLGITSIGITGGCISAPRLKAAKPDHLVGALTHVPAILEKEFHI